MTVLRKEKSLIHTFTYMKLPDLPKQNKQHEASFSVIFEKWFDPKKFESCSIELKDTRGANVFNMKEWKNKQRIHATKNKSDKGNLIRTAIGSTGMGDLHFLRNAYAYVVIKYPKAFYIIDADDLIAHKGKSLKEVDAEAIAIHMVNL